MLLHRWPIPIALCACRLSAELCIVAKRYKIGLRSVYKSNNVRTTFRLVPFLTPYVHPNPQTGVELGVSFDIGFSAKRRQIEQIFVLRYWEVVWVGFRLAQIPTANTLLTAKFRDLKSPLKKYGQTAADGVTLWIDRRCEVIIVANALKYSVDSH